MIKRFSYSFKTNNNCAKVWKEHRKQICDDEKCLGKLYEGKWIENIDFFNISEKKVYQKKKIHESNLIFPIEENL